MKSANPSTTTQPQSGSTSHPLQFEHRHGEGDCLSYRLDYCNGILQGISAAKINKLQRAQNTLARLVVGSRRNEHIPPILKKLHWLPVRKRITFKIATLTHKVKTTQQPAYLASPHKQLRTWTCPSFEQHGSVGSSSHQDRLGLSCVLGLCAGHMEQSSSGHFHIREINSISGFKRSLKTHLFCP